MNKEISDTLGEENREEFETLEEGFHKRAYSANDIYCKFQSVCEYYSTSCKLGEVDLRDCPYAEKIVRANHIKVEKGRKL